MRILPQDIALTDPIANHSLL